MNKPATCRGLVYTSLFIHNTQYYLNIAKPKLDAKGVNPKSHFLVLVFHKSRSIHSMRLSMENYTKYDT